MEDALLITGAAYAVGIVLTGGTIRYYFYPTLMLSFPALLLHAQEFFTRGRPLRTGALVLAALIPAYYAHYTADMVIHRVRYGHREMNEMRQLARIVGDGGELCWYDRGDFKDIVINWKACCLPFFINYINGTDSFVLDRTDKLPQGLSGQDYVISWDAVPEYEAAAYPELPITMFHVYYGTRNEGD
ncbi:MAG: hypothetical protein IJL80_04095 [Treponema sp.]|nr:hypothetical protein [Treponema sp.]